MTRVLLSITLCKFALLGCVLLQGCALGYLIKATSQQISLLHSRIPLDNVIDDPTTSEAIREKIRLVKAVTTFAESEGLTTGKIFSSYVALPQSAVSWIVAASPPDALTSYQWWFPFVGSVPYKGFFRECDAEAARAALSAKGYDTIVRPVEAYSTLGWFNDPLLSSALKRDHVTLANLILHELTHSTLWVPGKVALNESLASFVAMKKTSDFFEKSQHYSSRATSLREEALDMERSLFVETLLTSLHALYATPRTTAQLNEGKARALRSAQEVASELAWGVFFKSSPQEEGPPPSVNNAYVLGFSIYYRAFDQLQRIYTLHRGVLPAFFKAVKHEAKEGSLAHIY
jgi:predicted aminopeptidase